MSNLAVILTAPRFPENIGMAARACANMGCRRLILVKPEHWDRAKAEPLATPKGLPLLDGIEIYPDLACALAPFPLSIATTARLGGWRRKVLQPEQAAALFCRFPNAALVMGPEDRGLSNEEICQCDAIASIPTSNEAASLNLAQATLLMLYEWRKASHAGREKTVTAYISHAEKQRLEETLKAALLALDCLHGQNPDYFFQQWRGILSRARLRRHEYDCVMGFCRQIINMAKRK